MVSVCCRIHCGDNRISMACCKACKHFLVPRTILPTYLPPSVSQARRQTKKIHVTRLKSLVKIPDSVYLKNGSLFKSSVFGRPLVNFCFKMFLSTDFCSYCERSKQLENLPRLIDPDRLDINYIFKPHQATFSKTNTGSKLSQNLTTVDENKNK